jgi:hypothetical protein
VSEAGWQLAALHTTGGVVRRGRVDGAGSVTDLRGHLRAQIEDDLLHPNPANEKRKHKLKRLVQAPNSFFMDVKCPGCFNM